MGAGPARGAVLAAAVVFVATYALLSFPFVARAGRRFVERARRRADEKGERAFLGHAIWRRLGTGRVTDRAFGLPGIAVAGGLAMLAVGAVAPADAVAAVDLRVLGLLFGMMALVAALDLANVFEVLAAAVARAARTPRGLLVGTALLTATLSALVLNDAVVLLLTPVLVRACRDMGLAPMPYLAVEAVAANVGSVATPVGNPQNVVIALAGGLDFLAWAKTLVLPTVASLVLAVLWALVLFRRDLAAVPLARTDLAPSLTNDRLALLALAATGTALVGFVLGPRLGLALHQVAFLCGAAVVVASPFARARPQDVLRKVDLGVLAFFVGLFVLVAGVRGSGLLDAMYAANPVDVASTAGFVGLTAVLSNLVSNVPAVLLLLPAAEGTSRLLLLAAVSTLAGNATLLGAAANVIVAESARARGAAFDVGRFVLYGLPLTVATLAIAAWIVPRLA